jgi:hypothetical protein
LHGLGRDGAVLVVQHERQVHGDSTPTFWDVICDVTVPRTGIPHIGTRDGGSFSGKLIEHHKIGFDKK